MDVAKSGGRPVHGGSLDPDISTVMCPELSGQPAPSCLGSCGMTSSGEGGWGSREEPSVPGTVFRRHTGPHIRHLSGACTATPALPLPPCLPLSALLLLTFGPLPTLQALLESARG